MTEQTYPPGPDAADPDRVPGGGDSTAIAEPSSDGPVVVSRDGDLATIKEVAAARREHPTASIRAVFQEQSVADLFATDDQVDAVSWASQFAVEIVELFPPSPLGRVAPPPIVIGDGALARHVARTYLDAWSEPGWPVTVHCLGQSDQWARDAHEEAGGRGLLTWTEASLLPVPTTNRVAELVGLWQQPPPKKATKAGPAVIVATEADDVTVAIAAAVVGAIADARVAAVVEDSTIWPRVAGATLLSWRRATSDAEGSGATRLDRFADLLFADVAWMTSPAAKVTAPLRPIFSAVRYRRQAGAPLPLGQQSAELRGQLQALATSLTVILAAGQLNVAGSHDAQDEPIVLTPAELSAMAERILDTLPVTVRFGARLTALELAFRLPRLARRAGITVRRPDRYEPLLTFAQVELLAPSVHLAYQDASVDTDNATGSDLAYQTWEELSDYYRASNREVVVGSAVTHAAIGLDWRKADDEAHPAVEMPMTALAKLEHRRWALFQRGNGAPDHEWMKTWGQIDAGTQHYDVHIMGQLPLILADAGVEVSWCVRASDR